MAWHKLTNCKLAHGDCLEVMKEIPDGFVDMVLTDPPYGTTACKWDAIIPFEPMWEQLKRIAKKNAAIVMTASQPFTSALVMSNIKWFKYEWVWVKNNATGHLNAKRKPMSIFEDIIGFGDTIPYYPQGLIPFNKKVRRGHNGDNYGHSGTENMQEFTNYPLDLLCFDYEAKKLHPTQKPVALMEYLIKTYTNPSEVVLDFTMGSGTTGVACVNLGRRFIGIEEDESYFNLAKGRLS